MHFGKLCVLQAATVVVLTCRFIPSSCSQYCSPPFTTAHYKKLSVLEGRTQTLLLEL